MAKTIVHSIDRLREVYFYDPHTGKFTRKDSGKEAFSTRHCKGYLQGKLDGKIFLAHRVAWAIYHGE